MASKYEPVVTKGDFDAVSPTLRQGLAAWWEDEKKELEADPPPKAPEDDSLWEGMPEIDSKAVVKASPVIRMHLGVDLDPRLIRKGGYESFDDLISDLLPKLRASCPDQAPSPDPQPAAEGAMK